MTTATTEARARAAAVTQAIATVARFTRDGFCKRDERSKTRHFLILGTAHEIAGASDALQTLVRLTPEWLERWDHIKAARLAARREKTLTTDDNTAPLTPTERATMKANVGDNAARAEAARQARITAWKEKMAPVHARLVASKVTLLALVEAHRAEIAAALDTVRELTEARLDYKSVGILRSFRTVNPLGVFDGHTKALQTLIDRIDGITDAEAQNSNVAPSLTAKADLCCGGVAALPAQLVGFRRDYRALMDAKWKPLPAVVMTTPPERRPGPPAYATSSTAQRTA